MSNNTLSDNIQDGILFFILTDIKFLKICKVKVDPSIFQSSIQQKICQIIYDYYDKYELLIADNIDVILEKFKESEQGSIVQYITKILSNTYAKQYIFDKLDNFISKRKWEKTLINCVGYLDDNNTDKIEKEVYELIKDKLGSFSSVKNVLDENLKDFYAISNKGNICSPTGIKELDKIIGGLKYKELFVIVAPLNVGKSWMFTYLGSKALLYGKDVLHITLEMSKHQTKERYFMRFAGVSDKNMDAIDVWDNGGKRVKIKPDNINNISKVGDSIEVMKGFGGKLYIEEYPDKTLTIKKLESLLNNMELENGKYPDLLLVDGLAGLKYENSKYDSDYKSLEMLTHELRRIAMERNMAVVVSTHSKRESISSKIIKADSIRGSIDILNVADIGVSLNQTPEEFTLDQLRIFVMRSRTSKKWAQVRCYTNFNMGHFCTYSEIVE